MEPTLDLARRVDELDGMVRGLIAYIALHTPQPNFNAADMRKLLKQGNRPDAQRILGGNQVPDQHGYSEMAIEGITRARQAAEGMNMRTTS